MRTLLPPAAACVLVAALASAAGAQTPSKYGQNNKPLPGFDSKSEVVPATDNPPPGAAVDTGAAAVDRLPDEPKPGEKSPQIYYTYKGVQLPLKKFVEYQGSEPFLEIVDGQDVLWVAKRADLYRVLDKVLYAQLDTLTGAADDLYERHQYPAAFDAYRNVLDVLTQPANELKAGDLAHYPAVKSYLQLRMGQARSWEAHYRWVDSAREFELAEEARAHAAKQRAYPPTAPLAPASDEEAADHDAAAQAAIADAQRYDVEARKLLEVAAAANPQLWQANDELGILATERAERAAAEHDLAGSEREYRVALDLFRKAKTSTDAKETIDSNLIAVDSALADLAVEKGDYGGALDVLREAMELTPDFEETPLQPNYQVSFTDVHPMRGERIVVTAELQAGLARKYLEIDKARRAWDARPRIAEAESAIPQLWEKQGEALMAKQHWRASVGFFIGLFDEYRLGDARAAVAPEFAGWVKKGLERSLGERGQSLIKQGRTDEALALYHVAVQGDYVSNVRVLAQLQVEQSLHDATDEIARQQWEEALGSLDAARAVYADYAGADVEKSKTQAKISDVAGAAFVGLTHAALAKGDFEAAGKWADAAMHLAPFRPEWADNQAHVLVEHGREAESVGDKEGAKALYDQALAVTGISAATVWRTQVLDDKVGFQLWFPAQKRWVAARTRTYGGPVLLFGLVLGLVIGGARRTLAAAGRRSAARSLRKQAQKAYDTKQWNEAVDLFNDYLIQAAGSAEPETYELLARAYRKIGDYDSALRFFDRAAHRLPGRRYNLERAEIYLMKRNLPLAVQALRTSPTLPADAERLVHFLNYIREKDGESLFVTEALAQVQITAGDFDAGRQLYLRLLDLDPRNGKTLRALSEIARRAGNARERRGYLERLVAIEPNDAVSLRELGNLFASDGELPKAIEVLKRALEVTPGEGLAARIAELQAELLVREAEAEIARLSKEADNPAKRFRIGELHWRLGRQVEAKRFFEEAANNREYQGRALRYLGLIAHGEGNDTDAIALLRGYLAKRTNLAPDAPEKEARYALAECYERSGQQDLAGAQYDAIFEADPNYKDVATKVQSRLAKGIVSRGPQECPFCKRRVPGDAEFCPHCNYQLGKPKE